MRKQFALAAAALSVGAAALSAAPARAAGPSPSPGVKFVTPAHVPYYVVPANNQVFLFQLAQALLGDGTKFNEIVGLNKGRLQPNGDKLTDPSSIEPGWYLVLPCRATGSDFNVPVQWNPPPDIVHPQAVKEDCKGVGPAASPVAVTITPSASAGVGIGGQSTGTATSSASAAAKAGAGSGSSGSSSKMSPAGLLIGAGVIVLMIIGALVWYRRGRRSAPTAGSPVPRPPTAPVSTHGGQAPRASAPPMPAPVAAKPAASTLSASNGQGPGSDPAGEFRPSAPRKAIGARLRRRKDPTAADLLLADPAVPALGARALDLAGQDEHWWPYAALVGADTVTVHLAGLEVPEPQSPWTLGGDVRTWILRRSELAQPADSADSEVCPAVLGVYGDSVVVMDVARSHGTLLVSGDPAQAERVRVSLDEQLEGGRVLLGDAPQGPHWELPVDARGMVALYGLTVTFTPYAPLPETVPDQAVPPQPQDQPQARDQPVAQSAAPVEPVDDLDRIDDSDDPEDWDDVAVSSA